PGGNRIASRAASSPGSKEMIHECPHSIAADRRRIAAVAAEYPDLTVGKDPQFAGAAAAGRQPVHVPEGAGLRGQRRAVAMPASTGATADRLGEGVESGNEP